MPERCDLVITAGRVLTLDDQLGVLENGAVAVRDGTIVAVGDRRSLAAHWQPERRIDAPAQTVAPGFVDTHVHLGAFLFAGGPYHPRTGPSVFSGGGKIEVILPMVARFCGEHVDPELTYAAVRPALAAMLRAGYTGVVDAGGFGVDGVAKAAAELGIRAAVGPSLADQWHDESGVLTRQVDTDKVLAQAAEFIDRHNNGGRVQALVSAVDPLACSDELLAGIAKLGHTRDVPLHVHTNIVEDESGAHRAAFGGRTEMDRLAAAGLLTARCTLMHVGVVTDEEVATMATTGVAANHNPLGNALLGFGVARGRAAPRLLAAGVPVPLGSDTAPDAIPAPFDLMRTALALHRDAARDDSALTLEQVLTMATSGASSLGWPGRLGRIAVGQLADLVIVDTSKIHYLPAEHPVPALVLNAHAGDVTTVVAGRPVVERGELVGFDEGELLARATSARRAFRELP